MTSQNGSIDGKDLAPAPSGLDRPDPEGPERLERARRRQVTVGVQAAGSERGRRGADDGRDRHRHGDPRSGCQGHRAI